MLCAQNLKMHVFSPLKYLLLVYCLPLGYELLENDMKDCPCLVQLLTWFEVSDYRKFWNNERLKPYDKYSKHYYLFHVQNLLPNGAYDISEVINIMYKFFVKQIQILSSSNHPILSKFCQLVVKIVDKELLIVFWT